MTELEELAKAICKPCRRDNETNINCICAEPPCSGARNIAKDIIEAGYYKQETCHNISDNFDEFVCSKCGYQNNEVNRTVIDYDGEVNHYDYQFNYCPNCGCKVEY